MPLTVQHGGRQLGWPTLPWKSIPLVIIALTSLSRTDMLRIGASRPLPEVKTGRLLPLDVANFGDRPVRILGARSSCMCLTALGLPSAVSARRRRTLRVIFRPKNTQTGRFTQVIRLLNDSPGQQHLDVLVRCQVAEVEASPGEPARKSEGGGDGAHPEA
jgi:hypothetical protein